MSYDTVLVMESLEDLKAELQAIKEQQPVRWLTRQDLKKSEAYPNGWPWLRSDRAITAAIKDGLRVYGGERNQLFLENEVKQYVSNKALESRYQQGIPTGSEES